jgi:hypothetical protein
VDEVAAGIDGDGVKEVEPARAEPGLANESTHAEMGGTVVEVIDDVIEQLAR